MPCEEVAVGGRFHSKTAAVRAVRRAVDCRPTGYNYMYRGSFHTVTIKCADGRRVYVRLKHHNDGTWELLGAQVCTKHTLNKPPARQHHTS